MNARKAINGTMAALGATIALGGCGLNIASGLSGDYEGLHPAPSLTSLALNVDRGIHCGYGEGRSRGNKGDYMCAPWVPEVNAAPLPEGAIRNVLGDKGREITAGILGPTIEFLGGLGLLIYGISSVNPRKDDEPEPSKPVSVLDRKFWE